MQKLSRLVYTSFLSPDTDESCLEPIITHARDNNIRLDVTGFLIFDGLRFCQFLEGPHDAVFPLVDKIRRDPRHLELAVKELADNCDTRLCGDWPMALVTADSNDALVNAVDAIQRIDGQVGGSAIAKAMSLLAALHIAI